MRSRYTGLLLAVTVVLGCPSSDDGGEGPGGGNPEEFYKGGSRLKAQVTKTAEGVRWPSEGYQWFDSTLNQICLWQETGTDGAFSCVPRDMDTLPNGEAGFFVDASCTEKLLSRSAPLPSGSHFVRKQGACGEPSRFYSVGEPFTNTTAYYKSGASCRSFSVPSNDKMYRVGAEVAAGTFARGTLRIGVSDARLSLQFIEGEDGSGQFVRLMDTARNTACGARWASDGKSRCLPLGPTTALGQLPFTAANESCTETAFASTCVTAPRFAVNYSQGPCGPGAKVHEVGEQLAQAYSSAGSGVCQPLTRAPVDTFYFRAGAEVPPSNFVEAKEIDIKTHGRLKVRGVALGDSVKVPLMLHDTELNTPCDFMEDMNRKLRCFPSSSTFTSNDLFADAACTTPLAIDDNPTCAAAPPSRYIIQSTFTGDGPPRYRAYHAGAKHDGPVFVRPMGGGTPAGCRSAQRIPEATYYKLGAEIAATSLVEGTPGRD
ncbi:DUF7481 family protein [Myxococcus landrumensis]|uniref:DUF7481 domain-containing protein n=1 Tax=Myxococcus landrumensis TaxID=2813577 RepID=A0ABX7NCN6_9BACT|nr:hypothetical protein [Myxococcus landrumus]QSQ16557.1 hypothetical protein JY572_11145 [Myxococcus landrumus]